MIELTPTQRRELRARAHHLNPVVSIAGKGLTAAVQGEIERALQAHELIKVRIHGGEREVRESLMAEICTALDAAPVQHIGNILVIWRERKEEAHTGAAIPAKPASAPRPSTAKSASAFAAAARRAALAKAAAEKRRAATRNKPAGFKRPAAKG